LTKGNGIRTQWLRRNYTGRANRWDKTLNSLNAVILYSMNICRCIIMYVAGLIVFKTSDMK